MKIATTIVAATAFIALSATAFAQVTPGGPGERKAGEAPAATSTPAPANHVNKADEKASMEKKRGTTGSGAMAPGTSNPKGTSLPNADR